MSLPAGRWRAGERTSHRSQTCSTSAEVTFTGSPGDIRTAVAFMVTCTQPDHSLWWYVRQACPLAHMHCARHLHAPAGMPSCRIVSPAGSIGTRCCSSARACLSTCRQSPATNRSSACAPRRAACSTCPARCRTCGSLLLAGLGAECTWRLVRATHGKLQMRGTKGNKGPLGCQWPAVNSGAHALGRPASELCCI